MQLQRVLDAARIMNSSSRFGQLGVALHNYHVDQGCFPPAYVADEDGRPMHSWRVLLLPYLEEMEKRAYKKYDFTQPWNGPNNKALAESMGRAPGYFRSWDDKLAEKSWTTYVAVTGDDAEWRRRGLMMAYLVNEGSDKFLLVEVPNSGIHWMEPRDSTGEW
jgi:hypothetical protein